jgi:hypothetical protein
VALILCGTSVPVTTGAAQSINLDIEINPDIIFKKG